MLQAGHRNSSYQLNDMATLNQKLVIGPCGTAML
jgi:hypothetical protein